MAISAKIQIGNGGVQGYNEWELVYNAATQPTYKTQTGLTVGQPEPRALWHTSGEQPDTPLQFTPENKLIRLTMDVKGDDWDAIAASIANLKRALAASQRAHTDGTEEVMRVALLPDSATLTTYFNVITGTVDDGGAYYRPESLVNTLARQVEVLLTCEAIGYGEAFTLYNRLVPSASFEFDTNSDGVADGWTAATASCALATTRFLVHDASQEVTTVGTDQGIYQTIAAVVAEAHAFAWVSVASGAVKVVLYDSTASASVASSTTYDRSITGPDGNTWRRYIIDNVAVTIGNNIQFRIFSTGGAAVFYVGLAYLRFTTVDLGAYGWCSSSAMTNRDDREVATTYTNKFDLWDIPGDQPALFSNLAVGFTAGKATKYYLGGFTSGAYKVGAIDTWQDSSLFTTSTGTWSTSTGTIGDHYYSCTSTSGLIYIEAGKISRVMSRQTWRVFVRVYTTDADATFQMKWATALSSTSGSKIVATSEIGQTAETSKYVWVDLGELNLRGVFDESANFSLNQELHITQDASQTIRFDGVMYMPTQLGFSIANHYNLASATQNVRYVNWLNSGVFSTSYIKLNTLGRVAWLLPGHVTNRLLFAAVDSVDDEFDATTAYTMTPTIVPRASHLLGGV